MNQTIKFTHFPTQQQQIELLKQQIITNSSSALSDKMKQQQEIDLLKLQIYRDSKSVKNKLFGRPTKHLRQKGNNILDAF